MRYYAPICVSCPLDGASAQLKGDKKEMRTKSAKKTTAKKPAAAAKGRGTAKKAATKAVVFTVHAEKGKTVCLAGDFNEWSPTAKKMAFKARAGVYTASVKLAPGTYQYKFVIDGAWCADPENVNAVPNDQGTFNSVITVK